MNYRPLSAADGAKELHDWLDYHHEDTVDEQVGKAVHYGSADLELMGQALAHLIPIPESVTGQELAIWFYVVGKVARLMGGYKAGHAPGIDSWYDIEVYAKMAQKIRETGTWL